MVSWCLGVVVSPCRGVVNVVVTPQRLRRCLDLSGLSLRHLIKPRQFITSTGVLLDVGHLAQTPEMPDGAGAGYPRQRYIIGHVTLDLVYRVYHRT